MLLLAVTFVFGATTPPVDGAVDVGGADPWPDEEEAFITPDKSRLFQV